jgi:5'(3')-deoxyribonucleotidase
MPTKSQVVAIDLDDVLVNTAPLVLEYFNKLYGTGLTLKDIYHSPMRTWDKPNGPTAIKQVDDFLASDDYMDQVKPVDGARASIERLANRFELHIISSRSDCLHSITSQLVATYFSDLFKSVHLMGFDGLLPTTKIALCKTIQATILIDDSVRQITAATEGGIRGILFGNYPWNQAEISADTSIRARNWTQVENAL